MDVNKDSSAYSPNDKELQNFFTELHKQEEENERKIHVMGMETSKMLIEECNRQTEEREKK